MEPIHGKNCLMQIEVDSVYRDLLCATEFELQVAQEVVLATTVGSGSWRRKRLRQLSDWSVSLSGLTKIDNTDGQVSWFYILQQQIRGTAQNIMILFEDEDGNQQVLIGAVVIPSMSLMAAVTDFVQAEIVFEGDGGFEIEEVIPVPATGCADEFADTWDMAEGEFSITGTGRDGLSFAGAFGIINVFVEGDSYDPVDASPVDLEFTFDGTTISFNPENPAPPGGRTVRVVWQTPGEES